VTGRLELVGRPVFAHPGIFKLTRLYHGQADFLEFECAPEFGFDSGLVWVMRGSLRGTTPTKGTENAAERDCSRVRWLHEDSFKEGCNWLKGQIVNAAGCETFDCLPVGLVVDDQRNHQVEKG
jgi:diadenosine tetraphosphatase ApaH/serine/threonine PP2A family protein phosphatase